MQTPTTHTMPVPADILGEVVALCLTEHRESADMEPAVRETGDYATQLGNGRHTHDASCWERCGAHFDDSDYVVTVQYARCGWLAQYGVIIGADGVHISLWAD